jgi:Kef-type K+ transport system membrane component KefB
MAFSRFIRSLFLAMLMIASSTMITHKALVDAGLSVLRRK